jgi:Helicase conserved C-terminal domain
LKAVRHPLAKCQHTYEEYFCEGQHRHVGRGQPVWQANGAAHLDQLRQLVSSHVLYTSKDDVLKDLPPQTRVKHKVPVSAQRQAQHMKTLQELAQLVNAAGGSSSSTNDPAVLGAIQRMRMAGSLAKIDAAVQLAVQVLQKEPAVVIFSAFVDVTKAIHKQLKSRGWDGELLTGETQTNKRQAMVDRFQRGEVAVFCCTFGAGGVGLTLTAAATVILVDRPWTPGDVNQAEGTWNEFARARTIVVAPISCTLALDVPLFLAVADRVRRIGQTKPVTSIWISAFDFDDQIDAMLEKKKRTASTVLDDRQAENSTSGAPGAAPLDPSVKLNIFQVLRTILPPKVGAAQPTGSSQHGPALKQTTMHQFSQSK